MKRRCYTLIEVLIALGLFAFLFNALFFWFRTLSLETKVFETEKNLLLEERYADQRLHRILAQIQPDSLFFTKEESLVFIFDNGVQSNPLLSGPVLGRLFIDSSHSLCLCIWPHPKHRTRSPSTIQTLLTQVKDLQFSFYHPPDPFKKIVDPREVGHPIPEEGPQNTWSIEYKVLPSFFKLSMTRILPEDKPLEFAIEMPLCEAHYVYKREA